MWIFCVRKIRGLYPVSWTSELRVQQRSKAHKRSRGCNLSKDELMKSCHHELRNLQLCADMGGVPRIIWEVHSGSIVRKVVLSVRGCLMWGISECGYFVSGKFMVCLLSPGRVS